MRADGLAHRRLRDAVDLRGFGEAFSFGEIAETLRLCICNAKPVAILAETESFTKAAQINSVTQSAVSQTISRARNANSIAVD